MSDFKKQSVKLKLALQAAWLEKPFSGNTLACFYAEQMDVLIQNICQYYAPDATFTIMAIGGYGSKKLAPYSDIDLLFITDSAQKTHPEVDLILYALWDLKLTLGYHIHILTEIPGKLNQDIHFCTALLTRRFLYGQFDLQEQLSDIYHTHQQHTSLHFLNAKLLEKQKRHDKQGDSRYLVEPDIKNGKGGLRDIQTILWICDYLRLAPIFSKNSQRLLHKAENIIWSFRFGVHLLAGKYCDKITFDIQPSLAKQMGYDDKGGRLATENCMKHYFLAVRTVGHLMRIFYYALECQQRLPVKPIHQTIGYQHPDYDMQYGRIHFKDKSSVQNNPHHMVRIFYETDRYGFHLHPEALNMIHQFSYLLDADFCHRTQEIYHDFRFILCKGKTPEKTLRNLSEAGILGKIIPDFGRIIALMQFNMYHHYTVDEHLLRAVGIMRDVFSGKYHTEHPVISELVKTIEMPDVLFLAIFLHDIAKGRPEDHSMVGAEIAKKLGEKMGFSGAEIEMTQWLVLHHLAMSDVAQKRDLTDSKILQEFANFVQTPHRLKMLMCLTVVDIRAVGGNTWNGWKGALLRQLYYATLAILQGESDEHKRRYLIKDQKNNFLTYAQSQVFQADYQLIAEIMPNSFWVNCSPPHQKTWIEQIRTARENHDFCRIFYHIDEFCDITEMSVYTKDMAGLFTCITGAVSSSAMLIHDARIYTLLDGYALDHFRLQTHEGKAITDISHLQRLEKNIQQAIIHKKTDFQKNKKQALKYREGHDAFFFNPRVIIDNQLSHTDTVIEIECYNRPFVLHDMAGCFYALGINIISAHINSYGEKVANVFYIRDKFGFKIEAKSFIERIKTKIIMALM